MQLDYKREKKKHLSTTQQAFFIIFIIIQANLYYNSFINTDKYLFDS